MKLILVFIQTVCFISLVSVNNVCLAAEDFFMASAEQYQSVACQLDQEGASAGSVKFSFQSTSDALGWIEFNGLFGMSDGKYKAQVHKIALTKLVNVGTGGYVFEGIDVTIGNGKVNGNFHNKNSFEVNGYFSEQYSQIDCIYYRLKPMTSKWANKIKRDNPRFVF